MAGHSLGELGALVAAGALSEHDALELVTLRGRLMRGEAGEGGMVAVMGRGAAQRAPELAAAHGLTVANDNSPQQIVLSGARAALPAAAASAEELGLRATQLPVSGAFHSPMMAAAVPEFKAALERVSVEPPRVPVLSAVTAAAFQDVRAQLVAGADHAGALARDDAGATPARRRAVRRGRAGPDSHRSDQANPAGG